MLDEAGFEEVSVTALASGVFCARHSLLSPYLPTWLDVPLAILAQTMDRLFAVVARVLHKRYVLSEYPLGYLVIGTRPAHG